MALACVNVDLDSIPHYCRIHGLREEELSPDLVGGVYSRAVDRLLELFASVNMKATLFAIGEDLADEGAAKVLKDAAADGHEIGNHSFAHDYALTRRSPEEIRDDVAKGEAAIEAAVGKRPVGFRAPGYTLTAPLYQALCERRYLYDSSVFPALPYYAAKATVMGALSAVGRPSRAILDRPRVLAAPRRPYRPDPGEPYRRGKGATFELPVTVNPLARIPFIGTTVVSLPTLALAPLYRTLRGEPFLNLELHALDVLDEDDVGYPALARVQRDLKIPRSVKRERLLQTLRWIGEDFEVVTLEEAATKYA